MINKRILMLCMVGFLMCNVHAQVEPNIYTFDIDGEKHTVAIDDINKIHITLAVTRDETYNKDLWQQLLNLGTGFIEKATEVEHDPDGDSVIFTKLEELVRELRGLLEAVKADSTIHGEIECGCSVSDEKGFGYRMN